MHSSHCFCSTCREYNLFCITMWKLSVLCTLLYKKVASLVRNTCNWIPPLSKTLRIGLPQNKCCPMGWLKSDFHDNKGLFTQDYWGLLLNIGGEIGVPLEEAHCETVICTNDTKPLKNDMHCVLVSFRVKLKWPKHNLLKGNSLKEANLW